MIQIPGASTLAPDAPAIYDSLGNLNYLGWGGKNNNVVAEGAYPFQSLKTLFADRTGLLNSDLKVSYELVKGLQLSSNFGYNNAIANMLNIVPIAAQNPTYNPTGTLSIGSTSNINWIIEPQINYSTYIEKGRLNILVGGSASQNNTDGIFINGSGISSDNFIYSIANAIQLYSNENYGQYRYAGIFGRVNYNWEINILSI